MFPCSEIELGRTALLGIIKGANDMTSEEFIKASPTIGFSKALQILEAHGYSFPAFQADHPDAIKHGMSGSGDPEMRESAIDSKTLFDWLEMSGKDYTNDEISYLLLYYYD
tara:strand:- start:6 stop:338 length:333 start_codon:yes stop_codon:yes gene_type:complete